MKGLVVALEANRPTVVSDEGTRYLCYLRGRIQRDHGRIMVGDRVALMPTDPGQALITAVEPRANTLLRPPTANVSGLQVVYTLIHPEGNRELLDKRLVLAELSGMRAEIVLNKSDLVPASAGEELAAVYSEIGYRVWQISVLTGAGIAEMLASSRRGIWVLTGDSGVGKSSLLSAILPQARLEVQELSRVGRGRETTRTVSLWPVGDFWLADAPGYTALTLEIERVEDVLFAFPEFSRHRCRFTDCRHLAEPGCGVRQALAEGTIDRIRYRSYTAIVNHWLKH